MKFKYFVKDVWFFWLSVQKHSKNWLLEKKLPIFHRPEESSLSTLLLFGKIFRQFSTNYG
jgi:hypothetical protein